MIFKTRKINIAVLLLAAGFFVNSNAFPAGQRESQRRSAKKVEVLLTEEEALKFIFPEANEIKMKTIHIDNEKWLQVIKDVRREKRVKILKYIKSETDYYTGYNNDGKITHFGLIDVVRGKWGPITFIVGISTDAKIKDLAVMDYSERRGRPIKNRKFLNQFIGKVLSNGLKVTRNIDAVTGASISSRGIFMGINKILCLFEHFILKDIVKNTGK